MTLKPGWGFFAPSRAGTRRRFCWILASLLLRFGPGSQLLAQEPPAAQTTERVRTEIPYREGTAVLVSDFQERVTKTRYRARGRVEITYQDMVITCDEAEYDEITREGLTRGPTRFSQKTQWLTCSRAEFNFASETGTFYDASGFTDQEFLIQGRTIVKTGRDTYTVQEGFVTACQEQHPKWSFLTSKALIRVDHTARLSHVVFRIKKVPVFYAPYLIVPMEKKERNSGFLPPRIGTSTSKGRVFGGGYFQTLGESFDATFYGDYFSERGLAYGGVFRARPNPQTRLYLEAYGIDDRLGQGGAHLVVNGESSFKNGFRAVASVNATTNFEFRQAFAESFRSAVIPEERSILFLTRNEKSYSSNFAFQRDEVFFPSRSVVIRKSPSIEFLSLGQTLGNFPLYFQFRMAAEGMSRVDAQLETPKIVQRLDLFPRATLRLPSLGGFSLIPTVGFRETYYSARIEEQAEPQVVPQSLHRQYFDFELDLRTPTLEKSFGDTRAGTFRHVIEPVATYRWISGIDNLSQTIRFDDQDAIADTSEIEYGIVNRIFKNRESSPGVQQQFEFLAVSLTQKYYFDPDFGGALRPGESNMFFPLNTLTGFALTGTRRSLAPTTIAVRVTPRPGVSYDARADFDTKVQEFRDASLTTVWQGEKLFIAGTYFKTQALEPGTFESNQVQAQAGYGSPVRGFSGSLTLSHDIRTSKLLSSHTRLNYAWDCCGVAFEFLQFDLGVRKESRFSFSFTLRGIGSFGNIKRPETLF
jgi:LPS-assembly protein